MNVVVDSRGGNQPNLHQIVRDYLSYQDAGLEASEGIYQDALDVPSTLFYAAALQQMFEAYGKDRVLQLGRALQEDGARRVDELAGKLQFDATPFCGSVTWALWDMAKQTHFNVHPELADARYLNADPMKNMELQKQIVDRHVGWEIHAAFITGCVPIDDILALVNANDNEAFRATITGHPKENGTLSSLDLAELGAFLRNGSSGEDWSDTLIVI